MESKPNSLPIGGPRPIVPITNQADFAAALREQRLAQGLTLADVDHIAGFHDGYTAHLEHPFTRSGKKSFRLTAMGAIWLETLGMDLRIFLGDD